MSPPWQPLQQPWKFFTQSTKSCSEKDSRFSVSFAYALSREATVEKVQQLPHCPWFLTGLTSFGRQSMELGAPPTIWWVALALGADSFIHGLYPFLCLNSSKGMAANSFNSSDQDMFMELC